ncbi:hypothetical protein HG536_0H02160 [Torulaspora globosa]|uniref:Uncharacterized protein n=1 Tax=Torulaspora globosa TaxID=48254 RepID=A0A7G3ZMV5_9SACH|nr:uncharacterized protein HG536_0H02160 [Torulaspora globosa]QLL34841.1 hypothetical protein HG536_0H02160 [Torulaspora globosa]
MRKRGFTIYSDNSGNGVVSKKAPLGTLATAWAAPATRKPLMATDVNVSSIFCNDSKKVLSKDAVKVNGKSDGSITSMQSVLETAKTVPSYEATRCAGVTRVVARDSSSDLQRAVASGVARLNSRLRVSGNVGFDQLVEFQELMMLSAHELLVVVDESRSLVLHSKSALSAQRVDRFASMKLALNSQCYYVLYNDVYWYMRWKFF